VRSGSRRRRRDKHLEKALGGISTQFSSINQEQQKGVSAQVRKANEEEVASRRHLCTSLRRWSTGSPNITKTRTNRHLSRKDDQQLKGIEQQYAQNADSIRRVTLRPGAESEGS
jgi:hypothetical protein